jgi:hypothetical protein
MTISTNDGAHYKSEVHYLLDIPINEDELHHKELTRYLANHPGILPHQIVSPIHHDRKQLTQLNNIDEEVSRNWNLQNNADKE